MCSTYVHLTKGAACVCVFVFVKNCFASSAHTQDTHFYMCIRNLDTNLLNSKRGDFNSFRKICQKFFVITNTFFKNDMKKALFKTSYLTFRISTSQQLVLGFKSCLHPLN